jgi:hypothetical protein
MKKRLNVDAIANELRGGSAFFPDYQAGVSPTSSELPQDHPPAAAIEPTVIVPDSEVGETVQPVPLGVPRPVRGTVPRTPKVKRAIRQRQPFDIFEDQYTRLKHIAEAEREFVNGRGMSQMVREAIDIYLKEHFPSNE